MSFSAAYLHLLFQYCEHNFNLPLLLFLLLFHLSLLPVFFLFDIWLFISLFFSFSIFFQIFQNLFQCISKKFERGGWRYIQPQVKYLRICSFIIFHELSLSVCPSFSSLLLNLSYSFLFSASFFLTLPLPFSLSLCFSRLSFYLCLSVFILFIFLSPFSLFDFW